MSGHYLGQVFNIQYFIFPHHGNELAQSRVANPGSEVKCWMHMGFVNDNGQKAAKVDKNFFTIKDKLEQQSSRKGSSQRRSSSRKRNSPRFSGAFSTALQLLRHY
ncbi:hypothetical protein VPH35_130116 [Triticum aestivum]